MPRSFVLLLFLLSLFGFGNSFANERPDIILVMVDDMGFSDLGCYGSEIETPNIDQLAAGGVRFDQFYNSGRCCPTRATLMTGLHPHQVGIGHMTLSPAQKPNDRPANYQGYINERCVTIAEALAPSGYATFMSGKWHLGMHDASLLPMQRGYQQYYGSLAGATRYFAPLHPRGMTSGNTPVENPESTTEEAFYTTDAFTDHAIRFIRGHREQSPERPYFLYLAYTAPHWPLQAFEDDIDRYRGKYRDGWDAVRRARYQRQIELGLINEKWPLSPSTAGIPKWETLSERQRDEMDLKMAIYAAMIDRIDQNIGKLVESLKSLGRFENTLIVLLSDNGACAEGGMLGRGEFHDVDKRNLETANSYGEAWANASSTPFRLYKHFAHEGGTASPFLMHWPSSIGPNPQWYRSPAQLIDVMPTLLDVAGATYPDEKAGQSIPPLDGISLRPAFHGKPLARAEPICIEHEQNAFLRDGKWKLVGRGVAGARSVDATKWELYDMEADRTETNNLASAMPERTAAMAAKWNVWSDRVGVYPKPVSKKKTPKKTVTKNSNKRQGD